MIQLMIKKLMMNLIKHTAARDSGDDNDAACDEMRRHLKPLMASCAPTP